MTLFSLQPLNKERLDKILIELLTSKNINISRSKLQELIKMGNVKVNNCIILEPRHEINQPSEIDINFTTVNKEQHLIAKTTRTFTIIYEDKDLMVINKPFGLTTHPGAGNFQDTLANELKGYLDENISNINGEERPGIVHRLDKDTSGLMVVAKNDATHLALAKQLQNRSLTRRYLALINGFIKPSRGPINANIARDSYNRTKMRVVKNGGKNAITHYQIIKTILNSFSLIECRLETGRTHQIRVHLNHLGYPLVGEKTYNNNLRFFNHQLALDTKELIKTFPRQALHSYKIGFIHPTTYKELDFSIELASDITELITMLESYESFI